MQMELGLAPRFGWGGWRPGAGRKPGPRHRIPHLRRASLPARHPCHVTVRIRAGIPSLRRVRVVRALERSFRALRDRDGFRVVHYSIQSNHIHLLVEAAGPASLAHGMMAVGARIGRAVNRAFRRRGRVLADRYHAHVLRTPREVRNALRYVLLNARRHLARIAPRVALLDPASSARWFDGWSGTPRAAAPDPPAVSSPRTWLLAFGWRRWGLLGPQELPGGRT